MWLCTNQGFLSIVQPQAKDKAPAGTLLVRARRAGDIEAFFPEYKAVSEDHRDYQFRAFIPRAEVGAAIASALEAITYTNFKNSVKDRRLHDAYGNFWHIMERLQPARAYSCYSREKKAPRQRSLMPAGA